MNTDETRESMPSELISPMFRTDFREFCVENFVLRQITDCFSGAGIVKGKLPHDRPVSGQRRTLVEEYYNSIDWSKSDDVDKFIIAVQIAFSQSYLSEQARKQLQAILEREGFVVEKRQIRRVGSVSPKSYALIDTSLLDDLRNSIISLNNLTAQARGFEFEKLLNRLFEIHGLAPRNSFRLTGEQIDGSFQFESDIYLVEAKWQSNQTAQNDLLVFREKVASKSTWGRGLFISYAGFSQDGLTAFARGRATNIIGMDGQDLYFILSGQITFFEALAKKVRRAAETGEFFVPVFNLLHS